MQLFNLEKMYALYLKPFLVPYYDYVEENGKKVLIVWNDMVI